MELYSNYRSSSSFRVRIALELKGLDYQIHPVRMELLASEQVRPAFMALNPQGLVPVLVDGATTLTQSLAIIEYLEERYPEPALLPGTPAERARVRAIAHAIACDIQPLTKMRVRRHLTDILDVSEDALASWHWDHVDGGLVAVEGLIAGHPWTGSFCHGETPTLADCCLVPQLYAAWHYGCELRRIPTLRAIEKRCMSLPTFQRAAPESQPDWPFREDRA